jgi:uncharacterized protein (TIGR03083 family)
MMGRVNAVTRGRTSLDTVEAFAAAAERFAVAVAWSDPRAPVASCPGWSTYDLVVHLGNVHAWAATIVETGRFAVEQNDEPRTSKGKVVSAWYAGKAEDLYEVLRQVPPDTPCWNFAYGAGLASFWPRRQLHETTVHQIDLDAAGGRGSEVASEVCLDGVDEVLTVMMHRMHQRGHPAVLDRPVALTATDTGDTWVVTPRPRPPAAAVPTQPAGATGHASLELPPAVEHRRSAVVAVPDRVEAPAALLYRMLWHRAADESELRVLGDERRVRAFLGSRLTP